VLDLRGQLTLRGLVRLVHHAQGVVCPLTFLMHLAAAVESGPGVPANRACVVVAGGREPAHWAAYSTHQFLHTVGALRCCATGGCWRCRTVPIGDGHVFDEARYLCEDVVDGLPHCMDLITPERVEQAIRLYLASPDFKTLTQSEYRALRPGLSKRAFSMDSIRRGRTSRSDATNKPTKPTKEDLWLTH
jgi:ADP-heptose:LPS heptosyltransferase